MGYLIYLLRRAIMFPVAIFTSPSESVRSLWKESNRNKAFLLGMPALSTVLLALIVMSYAHFVNGKDLEDRYKAKYDSVKIDLLRLQQDIEKARRLKQSSLGDTTENETVSPITKEQAEQVNKLKEEQKIYLDKLIALAPESNAHRFELAVRVASEQNVAHGISIINQLAPENAPGYPPAHMILARQLFNAPANPGIELAGNLELALTHVDHVLTRDEKDLQAVLLKAQILEKSNQLAEAYDIYLILFDENPNFFRQLVRINKILDRTDRDRTIVEKALLNFQTLSNAEENMVDNQRWAVIETGITKSQQALKRFGQIETRLSGLIESMPLDSKDGLRRNFLQRLLADTYLTWADELAPLSLTLEGVDAESQMRLVEIYRKAFLNNDRNIKVLEGLTRLSLSRNENVAQAAASVYDPSKDPNPPSAVLNQQGHEALLDKRFADAIEYYEKALTKNSSNPGILNNLSYAYLVAKEDNAERALQLINRALRTLPTDLKLEERAKYLHTKGTALKQLNRQQEAISIFETAMQVRPDHEDTLRSVIECYRALDAQVPELYLERFETLRLRNN